MLKAVILAAGKGTRMESELPKVLHTVLGKPMVSYVIEAARQAGAHELCLVVGHQAELVKETIGAGVTYVLQEQQLGTGHAVKCARDFIGDEGDVLILCGDTPLIQGSTLQKLAAVHRESENGATLLSAILEDATGYGRIIRNEDGAFVKNVEQKDATLEEQQIREINSGMYIFQCAALQEGLDSLSNQNAQGEYYLPDVLTFINSHSNLPVGAMVTDQTDDIRGVNTQAQLKEAEEIMKSRAVG